VNIIFRLSILIVLLSIQLTAIKAQAGKHILCDTIATYIDAYDNYGTLEAHAFNANANLLVCVYSTGAVKKFDFVTKQWKNLAVISYLDDYLQLDISDDGFVLVNCPYQQSKLINAQTGEAQILPDDIFGSVFLNPQHEILACKNTWLAKGNDLHIYSYPGLKYKKAIDISWPTRTTNDIAVFFTFKRYGQTLITKVCLNPYIGFHPEDTLYLDTLHQCKAFNNMAIDLNTLSGLSMIDANINPISFFAELPDSLASENLCVGQLSADKNTLLFANNNGIIEMNVDSKRTFTFGMLRKTVREYEIMEAGYSEAPNEYEYYTGVYYTLENKVLSVNHNGQVLLWSIK